MSERTGIITMKGNPMTLVGTELKNGDDAPDVTLVANDLSEVALSSFKGKNVILSVVPSLDTGVCDIQSKKFNDAAANLADDTAVVTVSRDLPFAQKRWCGLQETLNIQALSDYRSNFGEAYGVLIKELQILARAIFVVNADGKIVYQEIVPEVTQEPNYDAALDAVKQLQSA